MYDATADRPYEQEPQPIGEPRLLLPAPFGGRTVLWQAIVVEEGVCGGIWVYWQT